MRRWRFLMAACGLLLLVAGTAAAAIPGPQHALCPACFGLTRIAEGVYTDAPERAAELASFPAAADATASAFYGSRESGPRLILCASRACAASFGVKAAGVTFGWHLVVIGPSGLNATIVTHERLHAELNVRLGLRSLTDDPVPVWFNEGLATHLSGDTRFPGPFTAADIIWVKSADTRHAWRRRLAEGGWTRGYGAAAAAVAQLEGAIGRDGLRRVIERVADGVPFEVALVAEGSS